MPFSTVIGRRAAKQEVLEHVRCPECGVAMVKREGRRGPFFGCSRFPLCCGTRPSTLHQARSLGEDSYSRLLRSAYNMALQGLITRGEEKMLAREAQCWLASVACGKEIDESILDLHGLHTFTNDEIERAVDAAGEHCADGSDFLVEAHEARLLAMRARIREVDPTQVRNLPEPEIRRRYDTSDLTRFEADLAPTWRKDGRMCLRCGAWSELRTALPDGIKLDLQGASLPTADVFGNMNCWDCGNCGLFVEVEDKRGAKNYIYIRDREDPLCAPGIAFGPTKRPQ